MNPPLAHAEEWSQGRCVHCRIRYVWNRWQMGVEFRLRDVTCPLCEQPLRQTRYDAPYPKHALVAVLDGDEPRLVDKGTVPANP